MTKLIILAAGRGSRLSKYTSDCPKGMLFFGGKPLLQHQIDIFQECGITDIFIIRGYMKNHINFKNIEYFDNDQFAITNMVESLMCAKEVLTESCIITYSDLVFEKNVAKSLVNSKFDVGVVVDTNFEKYWKARLGEDYLSDMESLVISKDRIIDIGKISPDKSEVHGRYVGALKFSKLGIESLVSCYNKNKLAKSLNSDGSRKFEKWHMTDLLKAMIDEETKVNPILISRGWLEFDTDNDYDLYNKWYNEKIISEFINISHE